MGLKVTLKSHLLRGFKMLQKYADAIKKSVRSIFDNVGYSASSEIVEIGILTSTTTNIYHEAPNKQYTKHKMLCSIDFNTKEEESTETGKNNRMSLYLFRFLADDLDKEGLLNASKSNSLLTLDDAVFYLEQRYDITRITPMGIIMGFPVYYVVECKKDTRK